MKDILKKRRCLSHRRYVEHRMAQLQTEIFNDAMATGKVNLKKTTITKIQNTFKPFMTTKIQPIFNSFQEYIESEDMVFKTLESDIKRVTHAIKDIEQGANVTP